MEAVSISRKFGKKIYPEIENWQQWNDTIFRVQSHLPDFTCSNTDLLCCIKGCVIFYHMANEENT